MPWLGGVEHAVRLSPKKSRFPGGLENRGEFGPIKTRMKTDLKRPLFAGQSLSSEVLDGELGCISASSVSPNSVFRSASINSLKSRFKPQPFEQGR